MGERTEQLQANVKEASEKLQAVIQEINKVVVGQHILVRNLLVALLAKGHILLEWVPGLAKTLSIETLAKTLHLTFSRIQFTPDLLPSDITGSVIFNQAAAEFFIKKWPLFAHLVLADEINRAPAKVQSALLEAMAEKHVTIGDARCYLEDPFVVMATQNPLEQEGTYALPEAQLDRFLLKTVITYPTEEEELQIMKQMTAATKPIVKNIMDRETVLDLQVLATDIYVSEAIYVYVKNLVFATRFPQQYGLGERKEFIQFGVSPRASLSLLQCAKVLAMMQGRAYVLPEDIKEIAHDVLRHRILLTFEAMAQSVTTDTIIDALLKTVPVVSDTF